MSNRRRKTDEDSGQAETKPISGDDLARLLQENALLRGEVEDMRRRVEELEALADSDTLTPLPNRRHFLRELDRVMRHVARYGTPAAILFVDVDGLKTINDTHGHRAGDAALVHIAAVLRERVRASDIVARIGGDEFGLLLEHLDEDAAREKAAALCGAISETPLPESAGDIDIAVSIGVAAVTPGDDLETALARADRDMYCVKRAEPRP